MKGETYGGRVVVQVVRNKHFLLKLLKRQLDIITEIAITEIALEMRPEFRAVLVIHLGGQHMQHIG